MSILFVCLGVNMQLLSWQGGLFTGLLMKVFGLWLYQLKSSTNLMLAMLQHSEQLCECSKDQQQLLYRYSLAELDDLQLQLQTGCPDTNNDGSGDLKGKQRKGWRQSNAIVAMKKVVYIEQYSRQYILL